MRKHPTNMTLDQDLFRHMLSDQRVESDKQFASDHLHDEVQKLQDRLGLRNAAMAEVLQDLADWFSDEVRFTAH